MYYTYILFNYVTNRYYIGYSPNLKNRIKTHLLGQVKSTKSDLHYRLVWYCAFEEKKMALAFEKYLKSGSGIAFLNKRFFKFPVAVAKEDDKSDDSSLVAR
jgi:putative endonuclease